jgi:hypothetical protein
MSRVLLISFKSLYDNQYRTGEAYDAPDPTLPSIIFFGVEISTLPKTIKISLILLCILDHSSYDGCRSNNDLRFEIYTLTFSMSLMLVKNTFEIQISHHLG